VGDVYIILKQMYSGNGVPNSTRIARVLVSFFWTHCIHIELLDSRLIIDLATVHILSPVVQLCSIAVF